VRTAVGIDETPIPGPSAARVSRIERTQSSERQKSSAGPAGCMPAVWVRSWRSVMPATSGVMSAANEGSSSANVDPTPGISPSSTAMPIRIDITDFVTDQQFQ
jgi:hypothetical protein